MVSPPDWAVVPTMSVPAVMADRSVDCTLNVPLADPTVIDLAPFGRRVTVPDPALTEPEKETSLAVMEIAELVEEIEVEPILVTFPVPSAVIVTPLVPVRLVLTVIAPLEPDDVVNRTIFPLGAPPTERVPLAVRLSVPLVEMALLLTLRLADAPVVVTEKLPPTTDEPRAVAPALEISAVPEPPVFALSNAVEVSIGVPEEPIEPVMLVKLTLPEVRVTAPDRVIEPEPLAKI